MSVTQILNRSQIIVPTLKLRWSMLLYPPLAALELEKAPRLPSGAKTAVRPT